MPLLFAVTLFVCASLLFMVQPMVGKMILPLLGGSPAVWNACMVFFQAMLLGGYQYSHFLSGRPPAKQRFIHGLVVLGPILVMLLSVIFGSRHTPIAVAESLAPSGEGSPFVAAMAILLVAIGVQFFFVSTSAPLLQKWFSYTGHPSAKDPYFLYAASNAGSLISLLGYPLFIEPNLPVSGQAWLFGIGFIVMIVLIGVCGMASANPLGEPPAPGANREKPPADKPAAAKHLPPTSQAEPPPTTMRVLKWVALAFVPSSWMLGVTFYMTTDIASIPLLWVIPLSLYLITFIIAFARLPDWFRLVIGNLAPVMMLLLVFVMLAHNYMNMSTALELFLHNAAFFAVALMCHYELALDRPKDITHLTKYFLMMSVGGVLGGLFNALIAPMIFTWASKAYEYHVTIVIACLMVPNLSDRSDPADSELARFKKKLARILDFALPIIVGVAFWLLVGVVAGTEFYHKKLEWLTSRFEFLKNSRGTIIAISLVAIPVMSCFFFVDRASRFALAVAILLFIHLYRDSDEGLLYTDRTFFGILKVEERGQFTKLVHGTTLHGTQINRNYVLFADSPVPFGAFTPWDVLVLEGSMASWAPRQEPLTYYHRTGPVGAMFRELRTRKNGADATAHVAMVGLGTGSVSCYALPEQKLTFYEIDKGVKAIVDERQDFFTYTQDARNRGATLDFRMGDARLKLKEDVDRKYALLLVDAFSSDAIPVHLLTKEAVELYFNRMTDDGILALHISNKFVNLEPVVARIASELGVEARVWRDDSESRPGKTASSWVALAKDAKTLGSLAAPATDQILTFGTKNLEMIRLLEKFGSDKMAKESLMQEYGDDFLKIEVTPQGSKESGLALDDFIRRHGPQAGNMVEITRRYESAKEPIKLGALARSIFGPMFHPLELNAKMPLWTDDYSDVLRVMMLKEVIAVRKFFGLPTIDDDDDK